MALERHLAVVALTDHDTVGGVTEAQATAAGSSLQVIPGVEISAEGDWGSLHFLGFYVDTENQLLSKRLQAMRDARVSRAREMVERLRKVGIPVKWQDVQALANGDSIGRPHVARALLSAGYVETFQEAFDRFVGPGGLAYVPRLRLTPREAIQSIAHAGGVPVLAHPAYSKAAAMEHISEFVGCGLRGLEVYYPHHCPEDVERLLGLCQEYGLLATGGTDFHGPDNEEGAPLGSVYVPTECAERLRQAAGR